MKYTKIKKIVSIILSVKFMTSCDKIVNKSAGLVDYNHTNLGLK